MPTIDQKSKCLDELASDSVYLSVQLPNLGTQTFQETAKMDVSNRLLPRYGTIYLAEQVRLVSWWSAWRPDGC